MVDVQTFIMHNEWGMFWEIMWSDETTAVKRVTMEIDCHITNDGRIVVDL